MAIITWRPRNTYRSKHSLKDECQAAAAALAELIETHTGVVVVELNIR